MLNVPKVLRIEPLPNLLKETRRQTKQDDGLFVYAPWQSKGSENADAINRYLNYETCSTILFRVTLNNPLKVEMVIEKVEVMDEADIIETMLDSFVLRE